MADHDADDPAPPGVVLLQEFVNSLDYPAGPDLLGTTEQASAWLRSRGVRLSGSLREGDRRRLVGLRELLRDALEANTGEVVPDDVRVRLNRELASAPLTVELQAEGGVLAPAAGGADSLVALLSAAIVEATITGVWPRLKVCAADSCRFAFYDRSKNGSRAWCSMRVCGSRAKARAYRERKRVTA